MTTELNLSNPIIQSARVLDVNIKNYTLAVASQFAKKPLIGIPFMVPYNHHHSGEGIYFMPEVGSVCWICFPSDGNKPFVMGWGMTSESSSYRGRRQDLNPGDIYLGTRDDNCIILRRGGVVQIGATPLAQRIYLPVNNTIRDFCENYGLHTLGGDLEWTIAREETTTDGTRPALLRVRAKEFADDKAYVAELQIGSHEGNDQTILSLIVNASGADNAAQKFSLEIGKDGSVAWKTEFDVTWDIKGRFAVKATDTISMESDQAIQLTAKDNFTAKGSLAKMEASMGAATVKSPSQVVLDGPIVMAGGPTASQPVAMAVPLMTWLGTHFHQITAPFPGAPTTPPIVPPVPAIASTTLLATK